MELLNREWHRMPGASPDAIKRLRALLPTDVPESYFALLRESNGGEGSLAPQPWWFVLDPAETVAEAIETRQFVEFFKGTLIFGSNGAGEYIAFDMRKPAPWPIIAIDMCNANLDEVLLVASDFDTFLTFVGVEPER